MASKYLERQVHHQLCYGRPHEVPDCCSALWQEWSIIKLGILMKTIRFECAAHLRILAALEERRDPHQSNVVVPHHGVLTFFAWLSESVLKDCGEVSASLSLSEAAALLYPRSSLFLSFP